MTRIRVLPKPPKPPIPHKNISTVNQILGTVIQHPRAHPRTHPRTEHLTATAIRQEKEHRNTKKYTCRAISPNTCVDTSSRRQRRLTAPSMASQASDSTVASTQLPASITRAKHRSRRKQLASAMAVSFQALPARNKKGKRNGKGTENERRRKERKNGGANREGKTHASRKRQKDTRSAGPNQTQKDLVHTCNHPHSNTCSTTNESIT